MLAEHEKALINQMVYGLHNDKINVQPVVALYRKNPDDPQLADKLHLLLEDFKVHNAYGVAWNFLQSATTYDDLVAFDMTPSVEEHRQIHQTMDIMDETIADTAAEIMRNCVQKLNLRWEQNGPDIRCTDPRLTDILLNTSGDLNQIFIRLLAETEEYPEDSSFLSLAELYNNDLQQITYYTEAKVQAICEQIERYNNSESFSPC